MCGQRWRHEFEGGRGGNALEGRGVNTVTTLKLKKVTLKRGGGVNGTPSSYDGATPDCGVFTVLPQIVVQPP